MVKVSVRIVDILKASGSISPVGLAVSATLPKFISGSCPTILEIDGGDPGPDAQFTPINGLLDGGSV